MRKFSTVLLLLNLLWFSSCHKEVLPSQLEIVGIPEWKPVIYDGNFAHLTEDGSLIYLSLFPQQKRHELKRYDLNAEFPIGGDIKPFFEPPAMIEVEFASMVWYDGKVWVNSQDTIFVYRDNFQSLEQPLRKIVFQDPNAIANFFTVQGGTIFGNGRNNNTSGREQRFKAYIHNLWDPVYDNMVYYAPSVFVETPYYVGEPHAVHNGYLFCRGPMGITIVDTATLDIVKYLGSGQTNDFVIDENILYGAFSDQDRAYVLTADVTDPANPVPLHTMRYPADVMAYSKSRKKLIVKGRYDRQMRVLDVSDPKSMKLSDIFDVNGLFWDNQIGSIDVREDVVYLTSAVEASAGVIACRLEGF